MKLGFVETGAITAAIVTGLSSTDERHSILLSPRIGIVAAELAERFLNVSIGCRIKMS